MIVSLPFLDVVVQRFEKDFLTSVYRKPTGLSTDWKSFVPRTRMINSINTPVQRALTIYSSCKVGGGVMQEKLSPLDHDYPEDVLTHFFC